MPGYQLVDVIDYSLCFSQPSRGIRQRFFTSSDNQTIELIRFRQDVVQIIRIALNPPHDVVQIGVEESIGRRFDG
jgi:hypothetical protein